MAPKGGISMQNDVYPGGDIRYCEVTFCFFLTWLPGRSTQLCTEMARLSGWSGEKKAKSDPKYRMSPPG
jgi:hypothetical protein